MAEPSGFLYSLPGVIALVFGYAFVHVGLRLLASRNLGEHDPIDNVLIQTLAGGYRVDVPPLYDWLLWGLQQVFGTGVEAFLFLKYGLLIVIAGFMFLVARRVTGSVLWAFVAVEGLSLVYQVFWRFHESYTDLVGAMALAMAGLWALIRVVDRGAWRDYLSFALIAALGLMTQYAYAVLLLGLFAAAAFQPAIRHRLYSHRMLILLPMAVLVAMPYLRWLTEEPARVHGWMTMLSPAPFEGVAQWARAEKRLFVDALMSLAPFVFFLPLVFPSALRRKAHAAEMEGPDFTRLIGQLLLIEMAVLALAVGFHMPLLSDLPVQDYLPMTMPGIVWLTDMARCSAPNRGRVRLYFMLTVFIALLAVGVRSANMFVLQPVCKICRWGVPYAGLAEHIRASGFESGTIVASDPELAGNLRRFFPHARFLVPSLGGGRPVAGRPVLLLGNGPYQAREAETLMARYMPAEIASQVVTLQVPWHHLWRPTGYKTSAWWLVHVPAPRADAAPG